MEKMNNGLVWDCSTKALIELNSLIQQQITSKGDYDNNGLDPSEEYFRKKKKGNDEETYFPPEESEPPHY